MNTINPTDVGAIGPFRFFLVLIWLGAAIQANILEERAGNVKEPKSASVLSASIGIGAGDGVFVPILQRGTVTPTKVLDWPIILNLTPSRL